jgi:GH25 family lysozyme M1 (1,4-beta-N-acetylmuramidase)
MNYRLALPSFLIALSLLSCNNREASDAPSLLDITQESNTIDTVSTANTDAVAANEVKPLEASKSTDTVHLGIDISRYQGQILKTIKASDSIRFLICKATQGVKYVDPDFRMNWHGIKEMGIVRGAYHFYVADSDPVEQATHFANMIDDLEATDLPPVLDVEQGSLSPKSDTKNLSANVLLFLKEIESRTGRKPILYTGYAFGQQYLKHPEFANYDLWLAEYSKADKPKVPSTWSKKGFTIWQRSETYSLEHKQTDLDVYYGLLEDLIN